MSDTEKPAEGTVPERPPPLPPPAVGVVPATPQLKLDDLATIVRDEAVKKFGNWMHAKLMVEVTPDQVYWLVGLVVEGMRARQKRWSEDGKKMLDTSERLSLASFRENVEEFVGSVLVGIAEYKEPNEPKKPRKPKKT